MRVTVRPCLIPTCDDHGDEICGIAMGVGAPSRLRAGGQRSTRSHDALRDPEVRSRPKPATPSIGNTRKCLQTVASRTDSKLAFF